MYPFHIPHHASHRLAHIHPRLRHEEKVWHEEDESFILNFVVPGVSSEKIDVQLRDRLVVVSLADEHDRQLQASYMLPRRAEEKLSAELSKGILSIKASKIQPVIQKIDITVV